MAAPPLKRVRDLDDKLVAWRGRPDLFDAFRREHAQTFRGFKAPENIIQAVEAAVELPFEQGLAREWKLFSELVEGSQSAAQRHVFFAERETSKLPDVPRTTPVSPVRTVGVVGANAAGAALVSSVVAAGLRVMLIEESGAALDLGLAAIRQALEDRAKTEGRHASDAERQMQFVLPSLHYAALAEADLVIEAASGEPPSRAEAFRRMDAAAARPAMLASASSSPDLDALAMLTGRPEQVVGLHLFPPASDARLLEVVRGRATSPTVLASVLAWSKQIGKTPVVSKVSEGFIAGRAVGALVTQAERMALEGVELHAIDAALYAYGFAEGRATLSPQAAQAGAAHGAKPSATAPGDILARLLYPVVNEGAKLLESGVALRSGDIDVALIAGYGWPPYMGGPMFWADTVGLKTTVAKLRELEASLGAAFTPCTLLCRMSETGERFQDR